MSLSAWGLSLALIGLGFVVLGVWSHVERLDRDRRRPEDTSRIIAEINRYRLEWPDDDE